MHPLVLARLLVGAWGAVLIAALPVGAVVISGTIDNSTPLFGAEDPGWRNVAYVGSATGVYLGDGWVITADHVGDGNVRFTDGRVIESLRASSVSLATSQGSGGKSADLRLFRLAADPQLPALSIASAAPDSGRSLTMIGAGRSRHSQLVGWDAQWSDTAIGSARWLGYHLEADGAGAMRWGVNSVDSSHTVDPRTGTAIFTTSFDQHATPYEAQAVRGDSGGGVFVNDSSGWQLAGIMIARNKFPGQTLSDVVFGNETYVADLAAYRTQIDEIMGRSAWQNQWRHTDVNRSGSVTPLDALVLINELQRLGVHTMDGTPTNDDLMFDVDGNRLISPLDLNLVFSDLMRSAPPSPLASLLVVPEPNAVRLWLLAAIGLATVARRRAIRRPSA